MLEDIGSIEKMSFDWWKSVYPTLLKYLQLKNFRSLMTSAFPYSSLKEDNFIEALDFLHFLLRLEPTCRPSAREALDHIFLDKGKHRSEKPDSIWLNKFDECASLETDSRYFGRKITLRQKRKKLHRYKYACNVVTQQKKKKWIKNPKNMTNPLTPYEFDLYSAVSVNHQR